MKKFFLVFLSLTFILLTCFYVQTFAKTGGGADNITSLFGQNSVRTCLKRGGGGSVGHPTGGKMITSATLNLGGSCLSPTGCEIWYHNTGNDDIDITEQELKNCQNGTGNNCDGAHMTHLQNELNSQVNVKPGWHQVTDFTVTSQGQARTEITIGADQKAVLGEQSSTVPQGAVGITVTGRYAGHVTYSYYAIGDAASGTSGMGTGGITGTQDQNNTQQIGTINDNTVPTITVSDQHTENCVTFYWDPFGRVFDAKSLEPMSGIDVTLLDGVGKPAIIDGPYENWDTTKIDNGTYNILISKEGDYQLKVDSPDTHLFTKQVTLQENYPLVYSDIYYPGDVFHEVPMPSIVPENFDYSKYHHDIPLMPKANPYYVDPSNVFVIKSSVRSADMGGFVTYSGKATFPRAKICLIGQDSHKVIGDCTNAEKYGNFKFNIKKDIIPQEYLLLVAEKVDLTQPLIKSNNVNLSKVDFNNPNAVGFDPILNHIEGYVYDENGKIMPKAKVVVVIKDGDIPFYTTNADDSGFFTIYSKNLPFAEYYLEITGPSGTPITKTTSKFLGENKAYLDKEKINLVLGTNHNQLIINPATGELNKIDKSINNVNPKESSSNPIKNLINSKLILVLFILALLIPVTVGMILYIKKNK